MSQTGSEASLRAEIEHLRANVRRLEQERDQVRQVLDDAERFVRQASFWEGIPDRLFQLTTRVQRAYGYKAVALSLFEHGQLERRFVCPPGAALHEAPPLKDVDRAIEQNRPVLVQGPQGEFLLVPLVSGGQRVGVLEIVSDASTPTDWIDLWRLLGPQLSALVVGGRLLNEFEASRTDQRWMQNVSYQLTSGLNLEKTLTDVLALAIPRTGADDGSIMLLNDQRQVIGQILVRKELSHEEQAEAIQCVFDSGLAGWVMEHNEATIVADTLNDERWVQLPRDSSHIRSVLAAPLRRGSRIRGLLFLVHHEPNRFGTEHLFLMSSVADQAGIAVENAYLLKQAEQRSGELALINEISQAISSLRLNDVLRVVTTKIVESLQVHRCAVFLLDPTGTRLMLCAVSNPGFSNADMHEEIPLTARPHVARAIETGVSVRVADVFADESRRPFWEQARALGIKSQLAVPLMTKRLAIGAISMDRSENDPSFTPNVVRLCETIAHQAAVAIENARLYEDTRRRAEQLRLANLVSHDVGTILDIHQLLWEVVRLIRETLDCYYVSIALIEDDHLAFRAGIDYFCRPMPQASLPLGDETLGVVQQVALNGDSLLISDVLEDPSYRPPPGLSGVRSELAVSLQVPRSARSGTRTEQVIGVLDLASTQPGAFSKDDQRLVEALAAQVAIAIENARLFGRIHEERAIAEAIIDGTGDAIVMTDPEDGILFFNSAAQNAFLFGHEPEPGSPFSHVVRNQALLELWDGPPAAEPRAREIPLPDGRTFFANMASVANVGKVAIMQDITHLKRMAQIKSDFVSIVSHDLRSPLQVIQTSAELLPRVGEINQEQQKLLDHILAVVRRISDLVQDLLDIGRIEAGLGMEAEPCAIDVILNRAASSFAELARKKGLDFVVQLPKTLPVVEGNPVRLDQVVSNLINNAIKFTPEGSVTVAAREEDGQVIIQVRDTGIGIPLEAQDRLFQKFYRVQNDAARGIEGSGLGLAIAQSIIESFGGEITVESFPRLGSCFTVKLPAYAEKPSSSEEEPDQEEDQAS